MKKIFIALAMTLALSPAMMAQNTLHRHNPKVVQTATAPDTGGIEAYSDTVNNTAVNDSDTYDEDENVTFTVNKHAFESINDPFTLFGYLGTLGISGVLIAILATVMCLLIVLSPFLFVGLILYLISRRKNREYKIVEKAVESGQPIPQDLLRKKLESNEVIWQKGIKNIAIGIGLMVMFAFIEMDLGIGIGALVAFYGVGQAVIARTSAEKKRKEEEADYVDDLKDESSDESKNL